MKSRKPRKKTSLKTSKPKPDASVGMPNPRSMEKMMADIGRLLSEQEFDSIDQANAFLQQLMASGPIPAMETGDSPLEKAQDLMYDAWEASGKRRIEMARRALEISPDCADAYALLAEESSRSIEEAKQFYEQGVKAGERALGPDVFKHEAGYFWGILETRPYMRAREGLARCLWLLGQRYQAIEHYKEMLRLNPGDNQGVRYLLADCLLEEGLDRELGKLLDQYSDEASASWLYTRALWLYRREGAGKKANEALKEAIKQNRFVPLFITGKKKLPSRPPAFIGFGDENEAVDYVMAAINKWQATAGAVEWLSGASAVAAEKASGWRRRN